MQNSDKPLPDALRQKLEAMEFNARQRVIEKNESGTPVNENVARTPEYWKKRTVVPTEPILIASTEDIGTFRVRANHIDAIIHYTQEQVQLKKANAPL